MGSETAKNLASRAKGVRVERKLQQQEMADVLGMSLRGWQKIERGEGTPSGETLLQFEKLGINPGWVLTGLGPKSLDDPAPPPVEVEQNTLQRIVDTVEEIAEATARRPRVPPPRSEPRPPKTLRWFPDHYVSAGGGNTSPYETEGEELELDEFAERILGLRPDELRMFQILGDSMFPTLASGDTVVANTRRRDVQDDTLYVVSINGEMLVKRAQWGDDGSLTWQSDNTDPRYQPIRLENDEINSAKVVGQVERMIIALPKRN
ncbi:XRE family transcriptional regulator [Rhizobium sp. 9140]|uniref:XRE family transcriptional regulator n=1 Tax=Rhizobium sp. 9140 TaxID=1761900 RepID=UPI001111FBDB|nr:LexA family transcriptional regulator [Rhizobium sp. 9140]